MIFRRLLFLLAGVMALAVSAGVMVVALAYGLFALVKPYVGSAGAAGVVAGAAALLIGLLGVFLSLGSRAPKRKPGSPDSVSERVMEFVKTKPITSIGGAIAAGFLAVRNPGYLGTVIRAFVEGREPPKRRKER
ncbi:MAG TPA: hypothetical protein VGI95_12695 [Caulobacteraceae bacterium]